MKKSQYFYALGTLAVFSSILFWALNARQGNLSSQPIAGKSEISSDISATEQSSATLANQERNRGAGRNEQSSSAPAPSQPTRSPFFPIQDDPSKSEYLRHAAPLEQILTPSSLEDVRWMETYQYPRVDDINSANWAELERQFEALPPDGRPSGQNRHSYIANVIAASKFKAGEPGWQEWTARSNSPFARALELAHAMQRFQDDPTQAGNMESLNRAYSRAFAWGERAFATQIAGTAAMSSAYYRGPERIDPVVIMTGFLDLEAVNAARAARGAPLVSFTTRPAQPWTAMGVTARYQQVERRPGG